jgi:general secretion pathway protein F
MTSFRTTAINAAGEIVHGIMEAPTQEAAIAALRQAGNTPMRAEVVGGGGSLSSLLRMEFGGRSGLSRQAVTNLTRELSIMLAAGQDLDRALRFLVETAPSERVRVVLDDLRDAVRDGKSFATALGAHPGSFPRLYVGLVRAGEAGGNLAATLERLASLLERERALSATVTSAMIYPTLLLVAAVGAITLLLTEVLPQFVPLFEQNGATLPRPTQMLIAAGDFVANDGLFVLLALALLGLGVRQALRRPDVRLVADRLLLRVPVIGNLTREVLAARFSRTLGTLLVNGVPLIATLAIVRDIIGNRAGVLAVEAATTGARDGGGLADALGRAGVFPLRTIYLLRLGEETAQLGPLALRAAEIHEEKTRMGVQRVVALLVPAITIVMGMAIAGIVTSLLLAMLSLNDLAN